MKKEIKELLHTYPFFRKGFPLLKKNKVIAGSILGIAFCALMLSFLTGEDSVEKEISNKPTSLIEFQKNEEVNATNFSQLYEGMNVEDINFLQK